MKRKFMATLAAGMLVLGVAWTAAADIVVSQGLGSSAYTASSSWNGNAPDLAFDGDFSNMWNTGDYPVGWIEVNLGRIVDITSVVLSVQQTPSPAFTRHEVWFSSSSILNNTAGASLLYTFSDVTETHQLLSVVLSAPVSAQYIQIRTIESPSWVAWNEIQVMAANPVPEPASMLLVGSGIAGLAGINRRRRRT